MKSVALIPAFQPDERLVKTVGELLSAGFEHVVVVDDGSGGAFEGVFEKIRLPGRTEVLRHPRNLGKGAALKTGFARILSAFPGRGAVSLDADGQHSALSAVKTAEILEGSGEALVLAMRRFTKTENIPLPNLLGNTLTRAVTLLLTGIYFGDTQCGLRGYSPEIMGRLLSLPGTRFEFETETLLEVRRSKLKTVTFYTDVIYGGRDYTSHFDRTKDSFRIYRTLFSMSKTPLICALLAAVVFLLPGVSGGGIVSAAVFAGAGRLFGLSLCGLLRGRLLRGLAAGAAYGAAYGAAVSLLLRAGLSAPGAYLLTLPALPLWLSACRLASYGRRAVPEKYSPPEPL